MKKHLQMTLQKTKKVQKLLKQLRQANNRLFNLDTYYQHAKFTFKNSI